MISENHLSPASVAGISLTESGGWFESAYIKWNPASNAISYKVYIKPSTAGDSAYVQLDDELIRKYPTYWRADAVGLAAGQYIMKAEAILPNNMKESINSGVITVRANDRTGFAFSQGSQYKSGSGAYRENGILKENAQVIYVTSETAKTVSLDIKVNSSGKKQTGTGIGEILTLRQKGYDTTPLAIRFIGQVTDSHMAGELNSNGYLEVKGKTSYKEVNMTLEGIGDDATAYG